MKKITAAPSQATELYLRGGSKPEEQKQSDPPVSQSKTQRLINELRTRQEALEVVKRLGRADVLEPYCMQRIAKDGRTVGVWLAATALVNKAGQVYAIATTERERGLETGEPGSKA